MQLEKQESAEGITLQLKGDGSLDEISGFHQTLQEIARAGLPLRVDLSHAGRLDYSWLQLLYSLCLEYTSKNLGLTVTTGNNQALLKLMETAGVAWAIQSGEGN